ncbi:hypothetical protein Tco_1387582, partial [Tanacetum coccineum]
WFDNSDISDEANRYGDLTTGNAPGIRSMRNYISRTGGNPDRSSGNTLGKSQTTRMSSSFFSLALIHASDPGSFSGLSPWTSRILRHSEEEYGQSFRNNL